MPALLPRSNTALCLKNEEEEEVAKMCDTLKHKASEVEVTDE